MDGVLLIDKPSGPTSHDVVARLRRTSGEKSIGHTGTLDPRATGLLPLVMGRATRLASFLSSGDKTYVATIRLGFATDTDDADGRPLGEPASALPDDAAVDRALSAFAGSLEQLPPSHSAKKVGGRKAYELARREEPVTLKPVTVTVHEIARTGREGDRVHLIVTASAGFTCGRSRGIWDRLGCGAHLLALRRTHSGSLRRRGRRVTRGRRAVGPGRRREGAGARGGPSGPRGGPPQ
jgi:tRNA pseudouridine55 synthase